VKRRELITLACSGARAAARAHAAHRRVDALGRGRSRGQSRLAAFLQGLQEADWAVGRNVTIDGDGRQPMSSR
jgi:hypothetical protein